MRVRNLFTSIIIVLALSCYSLWVSAAPPDEVIVGLALEPPHLDPTAGSAGAIDEVVYGNVFEGLTRIDEAGRIQPALAERWTVSDDGLTYRFMLRPQARFHNGHELDAKAVVFSLNRARSPTSVNPQKRLFKRIQTLIAENPTTVRLSLSQPLPLLPYYLGWGDAVIVDPHSADQNKVYPVGTGPFYFVRWVRGDHIDLASFEDYDGDQPSIKQARFRFIPDPAVMVAALLGGDIDLVPNMPAPENLPLFEKQKQLTVMIGHTEGETLVAINNQRPPFNNRQVRRALAHAIDRQAYSNAVSAGYGQPIGSHFPPSHPAYIDLTHLYPYDPERSRSLLAQAGFPEGFTATLTLPPPAYARRGGEVIAAQLARIGVKIKLKPVSWARWLEEVFKNHHYELTIISHTEPLDIDIYARSTYYFNYKNLKFRRLITQLESESRLAIRQSLLQQAQSIIAEDCVNLFLFQWPKIGVWNSRLEGAWSHSPIQANPLAGLHWRL